MDSGQLLGQHIMEKLGEVGDQEGNGKGKEKLGGREQDVSSSRTREEDRVVLKLGEGDIDQLELRVEGSEERGIERREIGIGNGNTERQGEQDTDADMWIDGPYSEGGQMTAMTVKKKGFKARRVQNAGRKPLTVIDTNIQEESKQGKRKFYLRDDMMEDGEEVDMQGRHKRVELQGGVEGQTERMEGTNLNGFPKPQ